MADPSNTSQLLAQRQQLISAINASREALGLESIDSAKRQPSRGSSGVRLVQPSTAPQTVRSALAYAKFLHPKRKGTSIYLESRGKALYERILGEVREFDKATRTLRLLDGERREVIRWLERMPGGKPVTLIAEKPSDGIGSSTSGGAPRARRLQHLRVQMADVQKYVSSGKRVVTGLATTGSIDRQLDICVTEGAEFSLPLPLLFSHDAQQIVGCVREATVTREGLQIRAELAERIARAEECWSLLQVDALSFSIGFLGLKGEALPGGGTRWVRYEIVEISLVACPANRDARARVGKSGDVSGKPFHPGIPLIRSIR